MPTRDALIVDDDADGRNALTELLEANGYTVRQAENGSVAVKLIGERVPSLMLLDLEMPVMSGWEVLDWAHRDPALEVISVVVLSAAASSAPDVCFVRKPCGVDEILDAIRRATARDGGELPRLREHPPQ